MAINTEASIDILVVKGGRELFIINGQVARTIALLAQQSKRLNKVAPLDEEQNVRRFAYLRAALIWMDSELQMTPNIKRNSKLERTIKFMFAHDEFHFPEDIRDKAKELFERWESENWGNDSVQDEAQQPHDEDDEQPLTPVTPPTTTHGSSSAAGANTELETTQVALPSQNDPLFGARGIMHGVLLLRGEGGRKKYQLNPRVPKQQAQVFGHNGIEVGAWFALQVSCDPLFMCIPTSLLGCLQHPRHRLLSWQSCEEK